MRVSTPAKPPRERRCDSTQERVGYALRPELDRAQARVDILLLLGRAESDLPVSTIDVHVLDRRPLSSDPTRAPSQLQRKLSPQAVSH